MISFNHNRLLGYASCALAFALLTLPLPTQAVADADSHLSAQQLTLATPSHSKPAPNQSR